MTLSYNLVTLVGTFVGLLAIVGYIALVMYLIY
jgi:hypothetical protein